MWLEVHQSGLEATILSSLGGRSRIAVTTFGRIGGKISLQEQSRTLRNNPTTFGLGQNREKTRADLGWPPSELFDATSIEKIKF